MKLLTILLLCLPLSVFAAESGDSKEKTEHGGKPAEQKEDGGQPAKQSQ